ncbi:MAG: glycosyltransferase family 39 protein [Thermoanaerobaculia bacterium]
MTELVPLLLLVGFALLIRTRGPAPPAGNPSLWIAGATLGFGAALSACLWIVTGHVPLSVPGLALLLSVPGPLRPRPRLPDPAWLEGKAPVVLLGFVSGAIVAFVWGHARPVPVVHDEAAYVLQARIFASGHWIAPGRPLPEFFEQLHVFVTPFLASKYPPGHSLLLVPGVWLGLPSLVPILSNAVTGALLFAHARRIAGGPVALVTWMLWVAAPGTFWYRASYLSENTTTALWLIALWALRKWLDGGGRRWAALLALCLGWGAITRPMTTFALALPIVFVFLRRVLARRAWGQLAMAVAIGCACLMVLPIWSAGTTGDWRVSPYRQYSRVYFPYEWTGFGVRPDRPLRPTPEPLLPFAAHYRRIHAEHTIQALPDTALRRLYTIFRNQWGDGREGLRPFAILGALDFGKEAVFALVSAVSLFVGYLYFAHNPAWTPYYLEMQPVLSFATALGLCGVLASILSALSGRREGRGGGRWAAIGFAGLVLVLLTTSVADVVEARERRRHELSYQTRFEARVGELPPKSIVFVHYTPIHGVHGGLVMNEPDLEAAKAWVVHDLGDRNRELARLAPERRLYAYDDVRESLRPVAPPR